MSYFTYATEPLAFLEVGGSFVKSKRPLLDVFSVESISCKRDEPSCLQSFQNVDMHAKYHDAMLYPFLPIKTATGKKF